MTKSEVKTDVSTNGNITTDINSDDVSGLLKYDFAKLRKLCNTTEIEICTTINVVNQPLSKINLINTQSVVKNSKLTKTYLFEQLKKIVKLCNQMCERDSQTPNYFISNTCESENNQVDVDSELFTCRKITETVEASLKQYSIDMQNKLQALTDFVKKFEGKSSPPSTPTPPIKQNSPGPSITAPEPAISNFVSDFITADEEKSLLDFLKGIDYSQEKGHMVKNFGAVYRYSGAADKTGSEPIPNEFTPILEKLKSLHPGEDINECLVNCFNGENTFINPHSDDELCLDPESSIYTISLGEDRTVRYKEKFGETEKPVIAKSRSLYTMTRSSQAFYTHQIDSQPNSKLRYSLTFRTVSNKFRKSTLILGDSNSKWLAFGEGEGKFGRSLPGKRVEAARVCDINPYDCAAYSHVVIMAGTNDLRPKYVSNRADVQRVVDTVRDKIDIILSLRKNIKIVLLPVLPTRLNGMNRQIHCYNRMLYDYFILGGSNFNISMPALHEFFDNEYLLRKGLARTDDAIHLNSSGLAKLAKIIKTHILGERRVGRTYRTALGAGVSGLGKT